MISQAGRQAGRQLCCLEFLLPCLASSVFLSLCLSAWRGLAGAGVQMMYQRKLFIDMRDKARKLKDLQHRLSVYEVGVCVRRLLGGWVGW